ncbi:hypothetical protein [Streptomyces sp. HB132]|uniref:hypothetical protein n=1 Tax=Streptomyces sp. HB132 TaxID=767388 RepID=UPI001E1868AA|nr:hypothetical protein [Streptomyces sp. HB132]MBM7437086.1 hypothetical protein [Streptomyces sp. HB132]
MHVIPRPEPLPPHHRGPGVFALLRAPEQEQVTAARADTLARALGLELDSR